MHGHVQSRDKDSGHTIQSAIAENPMLHANFMALFLQNWSYCRLKFYIVGMKIFISFSLL